MASLSAGNTATSCVVGPLRAGGVRRDPGLREIGMSFSAWRQRACVVRALALLITGRPVFDVALSLGYDNASSFATMFRRVTGQTPSFYHPV